MKEIRLSLILNDTDPAKDKRIDIHVTDVDAVAGAIKEQKNNVLAPFADEIRRLAGAALAACGDTDKIEIGKTPEGKLDPASAFIHKGDGSGKVVPFTLNPEQIPG